MGQVFAEHDLAKASRGREEKLDAAAIAAKVVAERDW